MAFAHETGFILMTDKGEWKLYDYEYEQTKTENRIERTSIEIEKLRIKKREVEATIAEIDLQIADKFNKMEDLRKSVDWCKTKIQELKNG